MTRIEVFTILTTLTALMAFLNQLLFKLKGSLGMAIAGAAISVIAVVLGQFWPAIGTHAHAIFAGVNYVDTVFHGMLCFLLFAAAMHVDLGCIVKRGSAVIQLSTSAVMLSTVVVAFAAYLCCKLLGVDIPAIWLLVFGALISPTDPVAVLALLRDQKVSKDLETQIAAESLLNDGTALVMFSMFLSLAMQTETVSVFTLGKLLVVKVIGGILLGVGLGFIGHYMLKIINDAPTAVVLTLAYALGGYTLGEHWHVSGPMVAATMGLVVGHGRHSSMEEDTQLRLVPFWEMFDELLNMLLFMLVGMAILAVPMTFACLLFGLVAIVSSLVGRAISVSVPMWLDSLRNPQPNGTVQALIWGGVRGGVSLAMALALPDTEYKPYFITGTWGVVMFSLLVQAPTLGVVLRKYGLAQADKDSSI